MAASEHHHAPLRPSRAGNARPDHDGTTGRHRALRELRRRARRAVVELDALYVARGEVVQLDVHDALSVDPVLWQTVASKAGGYIEANAAATARANKANPGGIAEHVAQAQ